MRDRAFADNCTNQEVMTEKKKKKKHTHRLHYLNVKVLWVRVEWEERCEGVPDSSTLRQQHTLYQSNVAGRTYSH